MKPFARMISLALPVSAALTILATPPVSAANWSVECLWSRSPAADRNAFTSEWAQGRKHPSPNLQPGVMKAVTAACGVTAAEHRQAQRAYTAYASGLAALAVLQSRHGLNRTQVLNAWKQVPVDDRNRFAAIAPAMTGRNPEQIALFEGLIDKMAVRLDADANAKGQLRQVVYSASVLQGLGQGSLAK